MKVKTLTQSKPKYKMKGRTKARTKAISMILILSLCLASVIQPLSTSAGELGTSSTQMETEAGAFLHTFVFQNLDGTRTMYVMDEDVKYINTNGETIDKDISLVSKTRGCRRVYGLCMCYNSVWFRTRRFVTTNIVY